MCGLGVEEAEEAEGVEGAKRGIAGKESDKAGGRSQWAILSLCRAVGREAGKPSWGHP